VILMRSRLTVSGALLFAFFVASLPGCSDTSNPKIIDAPPAQPGATTPVPKDIKQGGGAGSSGNMKKNPGASS
jgi:hypothetical protein